MLHDHDLEEAPLRRQTQISFSCYVFILIITYILYLREKDQDQDRPTLHKRQADRLSSVRTS